MAAEQAQVVELLWGSPNRPRRGPKPSLSLDRIAEAAIMIADAEGLAALSMQRIAEELGYTKMSLYRYIPGKAELIALMLDTAWGPPPDLADVPGGWRPTLHAWALRLCAVIRQHLWTLEAATGPRVLGPNEFGWMEAGLAPLADTGLTGAERLDAIVLLNNHVRGLVQQTTAAGAASGTAGAASGTAGAASGTTEQDLSAKVTAIIAEHRDRYPEVAAALDSSTSGKDDALEFGLARILDGLAVLIEQRV